jgi:hypothetical protein
MIGTQDGCRELWAVVLIQAIKDCYGLIQKAPYVEREKIQAHAKLWINNLEEVGVGSFIWICQTLNIDANYLRESIFKHKFQAREMLARAVKGEKKQWEHTSLQTLESTQTEIWA